MWVGGDITVNAIEIGRKPMDDLFAIKIQIYQLFMILES
jgi:hypothetical protein